MINKYGIIESVELAVNRKDVTQGYKSLAEMGLEDYAIEAVILRNPDVFSDQVKEISQKRMSEWKN